MMEAWKEENIPDLRHCEDPVCFSLLSKRAPQGASASRVGEAVRVTAHLNQFPRFRLPGQFPAEGC